jgi:hypothetical protein
VVLPVVSTIVTKILVSCAFAYEGHRSLIVPSASEYRHEMSGEGLGPRARVASLKKHQLVNFFVSFGRSVIPPFFLLHNVLYV